MVIQNMFVEDINRKINGVVKVDEDENKVLEQELNEYVITRELKRHFADFFNTYAEAFDEPTADTGVWISGFFGSGKSHFLKMLSYLLENKEVNGIRTVERFRKKFEDDPGTFMQVDRATKGETETILFNIDYEGSINKDKTAVLRVFAKVFYNHLGFFGSNLKVAMLEQYITQQGKMDEFCRLIEEKKGKPWTEVRKAFASCKIPGRKNGIHWICSTGRYSHQDEWWRAEFCAWRYQPAGNDGSGDRISLSAQRLYGISAQ